MATGGAALLAGNKQDVFWRFSGFSGVSVAIWVFAAGAVHPLKQNKCSLWPVHGLLSFLERMGQNEKSCGYHG